MTIITAAGLSDLYNQRAFNKNGSTVTLKKISETEWLLFGDLAEGDSEGFEDLLPSDIGQAFGGGYYIGDIVIGTDTFAIIMAGLSAQVAVPWKTSRTATPNSSSSGDGLSNTIAMAEENLNAHPAAAHCLAYSSGNFSDWYLPSQNELNLSWVNRSALGDLQMNTAGLRYWSSTEANASDARRLLFSTGSMTSGSKTDTMSVRPVRRILK